MEKNKALFMDLDHTVVRPKHGAKFPKDIHDWEFIPGVLDKMKRFNELGYLILIVSNQGGIELGYTTIPEFTGKMFDIMVAANSYDVTINNYMYCISNDKADHMRKPNPGMAEILATMNNIDLENSIMVGDMDTDEGFAKNAGIGEFYYIDKFLRLEI